jgi:aldehyde dehydrogenase (NAD+)
VSGGLLIAELFAEAELPPGVLNVVTCSRDNVADVGDELITNPLVGGISFTGSTAVGRQVASKAGLMLKKACVELGGKDSLIICEDADMELALNAASFGTFMHQGQICMSVEKIIVDESIAAEFTERFVANDSEYGLSAGIITRDEEKGLAIANRLQTGMAHVNDSSVNDEPHVPFGGMKNSGLGRHGGKASVETFTELRWLTLERGGRHYPPPFVVAPQG